MKKIYFTITGRKYRCGQEYFEPVMKEKPVDNEFGTIYHDERQNASGQATGFTLFTSFKEENEKTELEMSGLNPDELEFMKACERREVLAQAGLNPDEYDF